MNKFTNGFAAVVAIVAILLAGTAIFTAPKVVTVPSAPVNEGAVASPVSPYNYSVVGGLETDSSRFGTVFANTGTASTTVCNYQLQATSTLRGFFVDIDTGTTSEAHIQIATAAVPDATTTLIAQATVAANASMQIAATSTLNQTLAGGSWIVVKSSPTVGTASQGTVSDIGTCGVDLRRLNY